MSLWSGLSPVTSDREGRSENCVGGTPQVWEGEGGGVRWWESTNRLRVGRGSKLGVNRTADTKS